MSMFQRTISILETFSWFIPKMLLDQIYQFEKELVRLPFHFFLACLLHKFPYIRNATNVKSNITELNYHFRGFVKLVFNSQLHYISTSSRGLSKFL